MILTGVVAAAGSRVSGINGKDEIYFESNATV
jgi:hypothetical protein